MSYLLKENKKILIFIKLLLLTLITILFYKGLNSYMGNIFLYIVFSLFSNYLLFFAFRSNAIFFESFFSVLIWLGFWFKFTCIISFGDSLFGGETGGFNYTSSQFDETLIISLVGISAIIISGHIREVFFNYPRKITLNFDYYKLYKKYRIFILTIFLLLTLLVAFYNWNYHVYQRGMISLAAYNPLVSGVFKWLLLFGLSSFGAIILFLEGVAFKKIFFLTFFIISLEFFLSSTSMMSRGMIFNSLAVLYGLYKYANKLEIKFRIQNFLSFLLTILFLFYLSIIIVNILRYDSFNIKNNNTNLNKSLEIKTTIKKSNNEVFHLLVNRWVGIDGVMTLVGQREILGYSLLEESFNERFSSNTVTFYEKNFGLKYSEVFRSENYIIKGNRMVKGNTLMGIIAFMFYSGSYIFLFFSIIAVCLFGSLIEIITYKISSKNIILASLIGQIIAFRYIHFGYLPHQSYLLIGTIVLNIVIIYFINKFLLKTCNYLK
jgi:hypothetical protein